MAASGLTVVIPAQRLLELAKQFRNEDFLAWLEISAVFTITPEQIKIFAASDEITREAMDDSAR